mmetsp:Transcript_5677/g.12490  ORF Transcript_5677/g.12490 Transcript_5677/m.12490 type:complete len:591 (+) Transcript_5677:1-1773(+)
MKRRCGNGGVDNRLGRFLDGVFGEDETSSLPMPSNTRDELSELREQLAASQKEVKALQANKYACRGEAQVLRDRLSKNESERAELARKLSLLSKGAPSQSSQPSRGPPPHLSQHHGENNSVLTKEISRLKTQLRFTTEELTKATMDKSGVERELTSAKKHVSTLKGQLETRPPQTTTSAQTDSPMVAILSPPRPLEQRSASDAPTMSMASTLPAPAPPTLPIVVAPRLSLGSDSALGVTRIMMQVKEGLPILLSADGPEASRLYTCLCDVTSGLSHPVSLLGAVTPCLAIPGPVGDVGVRIVDAVVHSCPDAAQKAISQPGLLASLITHLNWSPVAVTERPAFGQVPSTTQTLDKAALALGALGGIAKFITTTDGESFSLLMDLGRPGQLATLAGSEAPHVALATLELVSTLVQFAEFRSNWVLSATDSPTSLADLLSYKLVYGAQDNPNDPCTLPIRLAAVRVYSLAIVTDDSGNGCHDIAEASADFVARLSLLVVQEVDRMRATKIDNAKTKWQRRSLVGSAVQLLALVASKLHLTSFLSSHVALRYVLLDTLSNADQTELRDLPALTQHIHALRHELLSSTEEDSES